VFSCVICFRFIHFILISTVHALFLTCLCLKMTTFKIVFTFDVFLSAETTMHCKLTCILYKKQAHFSQLFCLQVRSVTTWQQEQGRIQDFKLGGGSALEKLRPAEGGAKMFGVFRVKNHDFTPKNHIFSTRRAHPPGATYGMETNIKSGNGWF
jgi:hypothetical protein